MDEHGNYFDAQGNQIGNPNKNGTFQLAAQNQPPTKVLSQVTSPSKARYAPPVPNPTMRNDTKGDGHFGAPRGSRKHKGVDVEVTPGAAVTAPVSGVVTRNDIDPYGDKKFGGVEIRADDGSKVKTMYVDPNVKVGQRVEAGKTPIGRAQDVRERHGSEMTPHIHVEGHLGGTYYDMAPEMFP